MRVRFSVSVRCMYVPICVYNASMRACAWVRMRSCECVCLRMLMCVCVCECVFETCV